MLLIPAIDLKDGQCVRLKQGDMDQATIFSEDPAAMARKWVDLGARRLHLVDLNGAFAGKPKNLEAIEAILDEVGDEIPVQLGGGIRSLETIEKYLDAGLSYVIIGTAARNSCARSRNTRRRARHPTAGAAAPGARGSSPSAAP
jgi:phosphoribosylformimino-5-aminoimidazole carboxamide ribotide isomerase